MLLQAMLYAVVGGFSSVATAELYIYQGPDGERMVSDRPVRGYTLLTKRDTFNNVGHIVADRPIETGGPSKFQTHIRAASNRYMVDPALVEAIIQVESSFRPHAVSSSGATGLMQLMPGTAQDLEVYDRYDPRQNIHGGVRYISELMERFDNDLTMVLAAYNAGPNAVARHNGIPPNKPETRRYVQKVMKAYHEFRMIRYGAE
ncbi:MAG: lytic transglycosylase domain-containing protein [Pseudomonadales bacterium]|nr:lytic transglycosylase domain-containing protein [Pseudomonadales bacterium]MBO6565408.1 lytic transglycosylase domain-containing protein [Pseudomonadales bacterium]MBO6595220.1 lytic transglycosylase domain-containing protein [Pseudomonadales bacterium]MBO6701728.1 lytic transglycosylase domain-containing protein [Pseudomonadales bacterium]MBO6821221.1 lytic transglycosylase domain-containing protein [Pseudomonadales bacterium]